jgi:hypothetical protein
MFAIEMVREDYRNVVEGYIAGIRQYVAEDLRYEGGPLMGEDFDELFDEDLQNNLSFQLDATLSSKEFQKEVCEGCPEYLYPMKRFGAEENYWYEDDLKEFQEWVTEEGMEGARLNMLSSNVSRLARQACYDVKDNLYNGRKVFVVQVSPKDKTLRLVRILEMEEAPACIRNGRTPWIF